MAVAHGKQKGRKLPVVLTDDELAVLLQVPNPRYPTGQRNRLMLLLMSNLGFRVGEVTHLRWDDVDLNCGKVMVRNGKGGKDRTLWANPDVLEFLRSWRERQGQAEAGLVFTTLKGRPLSTAYIRAMVKRLARKAAIPKDVHPHTLRHTFATLFYEQTRDIRRLQEILGHADISTTQIYTHISGADIQEGMQAFSAGLGKSTPSQTKGA